MAVLEQVQDDVKTAMKARDRERAGALRMIVDVLQKDAKLGDGDEVAVLQRERKKRVEAAEAYEKAGRAELAGSEDSVLRALRGRLDADLHLRGNVLTLEGEPDDVAAAATVVDEMVELIEQGHDVAPGTIEAVTGALDADESPAEILD